MTISSFGGIPSFWPWTPYDGGVAMDPPTTPVVTVGTITKNSIALSWTSTGADTYTVEWSADGGSTWASVSEYTTNTATSVTDGSLLSNTGYDYRVRATNTNGNSGYGTASGSTLADSPSWTLDFSTGTPSGYTLTRASSGTYIDSSGYVASASTDGARLTHNSSGSRLGLLVEEARTNVIQYSEDFNSWTKYAITITTNSSGTTAPDNSNNADIIVEDSTLDGHRAASAARTVSTSSSYTASVYVKALNRNYCAIALYGSGGTGCRFTQTFDLTGSGSLGNSNSTSSPTGTGATITSVGSGWFRITVKMDSQTNTSISMALCASDSASPSYTSNAPNYTGNGLGAIYVWGAQMENGEATAYIPTTTASVTRSADLVHVLKSSITDWQDPGAVVVHFYPPGQAGTIASTDDGSAVQLGIEASTTTAARAFWSNGSTSTGTIGSGVQKAVHYWNGTASKFCINAGTVQSGTNNIGTFGNIDFLTLGAEATDSSNVPGTFSQYSNCIIRKVEFYKGTATDGQLQARTL